MSGNKSHRSRDRLGSSSDSEVGPLAGPLVAYEQSGESTPLLPGKTRPQISRERVKTILYGLVALSALFFVIYNMYMHFTHCPLYPSTMEAIRRNWKKEIAQHDTFRGGWELEKQEHAFIEQEWKRQTEWHERDVAHRIREEDERQERVRQQWAQELERHAREVDEYDKAAARRMHEEQERQERVRKEWDREVREHEKESARRTHEEEERQEKVRKEWAQEIEKHLHEWNEMVHREEQLRENERQKWRREVEEHDRIKEGLRKHEEEERQRLNMFWGNVVAHTCTSYATREYTAQLMNLPSTWEHRVEACKATPLEVHGVSYLPKSCEDKGPGAVVGRWEVNQHEPDCTTFWDLYNNKGCTSPGSGKKYITHKLENLPAAGDWREFCATTPIHFDHLQFSGAQECFQSVWGVFGQWELDDSNC